MEVVAFGPKLQQQEPRRIQDKCQNERGSEDKTEEKFGNGKNDVEVTQKGRNLDEENRQEVLKAVCAFDGFTPPLGEDPSCRCDMKTFIKEMLLQFAAQHQENLETSRENHREYVILVPAIQDFTDLMVYTQHDDMEPSSSTCEGNWFLEMGPLQQLLKERVHMH